MDANALLSENLALLVASSGTAASNAVLTSTYVKPDNVRKLLAYFHLVAPTDAETVTFELVKASDSSGTGAAAIKSTTLTAHVTNNDNTVHWINFDGAETDEAKPWIAARITTSSTGGTVVCFGILGGNFRQWPATLYNNAKLVTVTE